MPLFVAGAADLLARLLFEQHISTRRRSRRRSARGAYKVGRFEAGRFIEFERVKDWWGAELPVMRGQNNFDIVRFEYYRDRDVGFEGFTGGQLPVPRGVHLAHLGDALRFPGAQGRPRQAARLPDETPSGAQGWFINTRREKFKDRRLREALIDAFDFEWTNKNIMYGSYKRTHSVFQNSTMMARASRAGASWSCSSRSAARCRTRCSASPIVPPVTDGSGQDRALLRKAAKLLHEAGCADQGRQARRCRRASRSRSNS